MLLGRREDASLFDKGSATPLSISNNQNRHARRPQDRLVAVMVKQLNRNPKTIHIIWDIHRDRGPGRGKCRM